MRRPDICINKGFINIVMKKILFLLLFFSATVQAKEITKNYKTWSITCMVDHGQILPNSHIIVRFISEMTGSVTMEFNGVYTDDACVEITLPQSHKIKCLIQNEEGRLNPMNKEMPQISVLSITLADEVYLGGKKFTTSEDANSYILTSGDGIRFPSCSVVYPPTIIGEPLSLSIKIRKDSLLSMYHIESKELVFKNKLQAILMYENGHAEGLISVKKQMLDIEKATIDLNTGEKISVDFSCISEDNKYAITADGIKLPPFWYENFQNRPRPYNDETLTHYYHRVYTADSLYKNELGKSGTEEKLEELKKKNTTKSEADLIAQVEALGETPYQKAIKNIQTKYMKRFERECWVSSEVILGSALVSGIAGLSITNMAKFTVEMAPCLMEAVMKRPATAKSIMADMEKEMEDSGMLKLRKPIEKELEDLQLKQVKEKMDNK